MLDYEITNILVGFTLDYIESHSSNSIQSIMDAQKKISPVIILSGIAYGNFITELINKGKSNSIIAKTTGLLSGIMLSQLVLLKLYGKNINKFAEYMKSMAKGITHTIITPNIHNILQPFTKIVAKIISPLFRLPSYSNIDKIQSNWKDDIKSFFINFILWSIAGSFLLVLKYVKENNKDTKYIDILRITKDTFLEIFSGKKSNEMSRKIESLKYKRSLYENELQIGLKGMTQSSFNQFINFINKSVESSEEEMKEEIIQILDEIKGKLNSVSKYPAKISIYVEKNLSTKDYLESLKQYSELVDGVVTSASRCSFKYNQFELILVINKGMYPTVYNAMMNTVAKIGYLILMNSERSTNMMTDNDVAAIMAHEIGHYATNQKSISLVAVYAALLGRINFYGSSLLRASVSSILGYLSTIAGRIQEIQADKYAIEHGYGPQLASALAKLHGVNPNNIISLSKKDTYSYHSTLRLRYDAIMKYSKKIKI